VIAHGAPRAHLPRRGERAQLLRARTNRARRDSARKSMNLLHKLGALCVLTLPCAAQWVEGSITMTGGGGWMIGNTNWSEEIDDPMGVILSGDEGRVNTIASSNGDHCEAHGLARDVVAGGLRLSQTANAYGVHFCEWNYIPTEEEPLGEVEIQQSAGVDGAVTLTNQHCAGAALGYAEASSNVLMTSLAVLDDSAAETISGGLGNVSAAYTGISGYSANVSVGNGTFGDTDFASDANAVCINYVFVQHRSRAFVRVSALRSSGSAGTTEADADMTGDCVTWLYLGVCPH
jgi:hypothetical protein